MDTNYLENNYLTLVGKVTGEKRFSHEIYGERFYIFDLSIARLSGNADIIPVTVSERLVTDSMLEDGKRLIVKGQFRSYNSYENEKNNYIKNELLKLKGKQELKIAIVIGPEGGLEEKDVEYLKQNGSSVVTLGNRILRTETVALNLLSIIMYELEN
mgnify:CR=1 FL=1